MANEEVMEALGKRGKNFDFARGKIRQAIEDGKASIGMGNADHGKIYDSGIVIINGKWFNLLDFL